MKLRITKAVLLAVAALVFSPAARAQTINVRARIPFDFVLGEKIYPAGEYAIKTTSDGSYALFVQNEQGTVEVLTRSHPCDSTGLENHANQAELLFHRMGETSFLYRILVGGGTQGREFPKPAYERRKATKQREVETIVITANVVV